ncbi:MAG: VCBS repeat-containing protein [bacterium]|nr:VCBS repeat-containing protein [bacterium]
MKRFWIPTAMLALAAALGPIACETMYVTPSSEDEDPRDYVVSGKTTSFFSAIQVDPRSEDSAGPQFIAAADLDGDGMTDLASGWNESQPVQVHFQRRDVNGEIVFESIGIAGTTPIARVSGLKIADMDRDGRPDLVVLIKDTGLLAICDVERDDCDVTDNGGIVPGAVPGGLVIFYAPENEVTDIWEPAILNNSFFAGTDGDTPEEGGYTGMDVGDFDGQDGPDIVVAFNSAEGDPKINRVDMYLNPGGDASRNDDGWDGTTVFADLPEAKSVAVLDVDRDGDLDIVGTYPISKRSNVFWLPNPLSRDGVEAVANPLAWNVIAPIGRVATGADTLGIADVDADGISDVLVRSSAGSIVQWFKGPNDPSTTFVRSPWQVFTIAQFVDREPQGFAVGDLTGDAQVEAVIAAQGAVVWFDSAVAPSVFDHWGENLIIDEGPPPDAGTGGVVVPDLDQIADPTSITAPTLDPTSQTLEDTGTFINGMLIVDVDGDGVNDIVGTIDRNDLSGLVDDALVLFRNNNVIN